MTPRTTRRSLATFAALSIVLMACGSDDNAASDTAAPAATTAGSAAPAATTAAPADTTAAPADTGGAATTAAPAAGASDLTSLAADCTKEAKVNLIALPDEWANYKGILQSFRDKYPGVENPVANPNVSSQEELDAVVNLAGQDDMPDTIDVSPAKASYRHRRGSVRSVRRRRIDLRGPRQPEGPGRQLGCRVLRHHLDRRPTRPSCRTHPRHGPT